MPLPATSLGADPCADCPNHSVTPDPYQWHNYVALRFFDKGRPLEHTHPFAERTPGDYALNQPLRFGAIYLVRGNNDRYFRRIPRTVRCVRGRDTMTVQFRPYWAKTIVYDSIAFQPGRYALIEQAEWETYHGPYAHDAAQKLFANYYIQHQADLRRANPFTGCRFLDREPHFTSNPDKYVPATPRDIFCLLLQHTSYTVMRGVTMHPLAKDENLPVLR